MMAVADSLAETIIDASSSAAAATDAVDCCYVVEVGRGPPRLMFSPWLMLVLGARAVSGSWKRVIGIPTREVSPLFYKTCPLL